MLLINKKWCGRRMINYWISRSINYALRTLQTGGFRLKCDRVVPTILIIFFPNRLFFINVKIIEQYYSRHQA
ncbi:MAG TPA: hypothetical protein DDZ60_12590 [Planktothrix sp. UBA10369]|nr:hypothetical protein [Planktothrix sp. UBA10369]